MNRALRRDIARAVESFPIETDGAEFKPLSNFNIEKVSRGLYRVSGITLGTVQEPVRSTDYYESDWYKEHSVEAEVVLLAHTFRHSQGTDIELLSLDYDKEPWGRGWDD